MPKNKRDSLSALDAAAVVLRDSKAPLHFRELTQRMLDRRLWTSASRTPEASVQAQIAVDVERHGPKSRFRRVAPGTFAFNPKA